MWCPDGYLTWNGFRETCASTATNYFRALPGANVRPLSIEAVRTANLGYATGHWLMHQALEQNTLSICSAEGVCLKVDTQSLSSFEIDDSGDNVLEYEPLINMGTPPPEWITAYVSPDFAFLDWTTGILSTDPERIENISRRIEGMNDADLRDWLRGEWTQAQIIASRFDGWALCIKEDDGCGFFDKVLSGYVDEDTTDNALLPSERGGRPRERDRAAAVYAKLFPEGHRPMTWKQVVRLIAEETGVHYHPATVKRGLEEMQQNPSQNPIK